MRTSVSRREIVPIVGGAFHSGHREGKTILPVWEMGRTSLRRCQLARSGTQDFLDVAERKYLNELPEVRRRGELGALSGVEGCDIRDGHAGFRSQGGDELPGIRKLDVCRHMELFDPVFAQLRRAVLGRLCAGALTP